MNYAKFDHSPKCQKYRPTKQCQSVFYPCSCLDPYSGIKLISAKYILNCNYVLCIEFQILSSIDQMSEAEVTKRLHPD